MASDYTTSILTITSILFLTIIPLGKCDELDNLLNKAFKIKNIYDLLNYTSDDLNIDKENEKSFREGLKSEDIDLNATQIIKKYGFPAEEYSVISDQYVLKLFRIPGNGPVVFLMSGILSDADVYIAPGPDFALGLLLATKGYDVWFGNPRGSKYVTKNPDIDSSEKDYWNFSWHEMGLYDLPLLIDFVLDKSNSSSLTYIGWSQGCTVFYVMCSLRPEYNDKIDVMISLSAVAWTSHSISPLYKILAPINEELYPVSSSLGIYDVFSHNSFSEILLQSLCKNVASAYIVCENIFFILAGFNPAQTNFPRLPVIYNHFPTGSSIKQFTHFVQLYKTGTFRQYDHGAENIVKYGSIEPPSYPVENISAPVAIFYSDGDWLCAKEDVDILQSKLPNVVDFFTVPDEKFNHIDFVFAKDMKSLIFPRVVDLIEQYKSDNV